jgi:hypothetical protein
MKSLGLILASVTIVNAQSVHSYGPDRIWWDAGQGGMLPWEESYDNPAGEGGIVNTTSAIKTDGHPFFTSLGTNGRACVTCHQPSNAMSVSAEAVRGRWKETEGKDPIFAAVDGSNCPNLPQSEAASHSLLLGYGLFRISIPVPSKAEFQIEVVRDPTGCNTSPLYGLHSSNPAVNVYRRPRIAANMKYVIGELDGLNFMADAREPSLTSQATNAALTHEQATTAPTTEQLLRIVEFETQIFTAQSSDKRAGLLNERGGPGVLSPQNLATGKAVSLGSNQAPPAFDVWKKTADQGDLGLQREFRASVSRGSEIFFSRQFKVRGKEGAVTCATCHSPGAARAFDIGTTNLPEAKESNELPLFKVTCDAAAAPHPALGRVIYTQDPGRALITGKCADVGSIVIQQFRGLSARAPYFSNGSALGLLPLVEFYNLNFDIGYTEKEKQDLVNFLSVL